MSIKAIYLRNFRLYEEKLHEFYPGVNFIQGPNGTGKTSLLEAVYFLMAGRSFRASQTSDLIRHGCSYFAIEASIVKHGIEQSIRVYYSAKERRVIHNATSYPFLNSLLGILPGVVIHPGDDVIVKGAPAGRRQLLDTLLGQSDPLYVHHTTRYDRAMRHRNHLLRAKNAVTIDSWEYEMAHSAAYIVKQRSQATERLRCHGVDLYRMLSGGHEALGLLYRAHGAGDYKGEGELHQLFRDQFRRHRRREMEIGATLTGPHKDDLIISINEKEARSFGSEGQQRSCVAAMRLAEWRLLQGVSDEMPVMLIDDIGTSLDATRKQHLLDYVSTLGQVLVTTTAQSA